MIKKPIPQIAKEVMPAVVSIIASKHLEEIEKEIPQEMIPYLPLKKKQRAMLENMADAHGMVEVGGGSGFIVDEGGIIVTNRHVIADPQAEYSVITNTDQKFRAEVIARDPSNDVAILRLHATDETKGPIKKLKTLKLGDSSKATLGESIVAIGNSLGIFRNTVSSGIVSGLSRSIRAQVSPKSPMQEMRGLIQTDAAINPGNSGGPLLNLSGQVVGINAAIVYGAQNIGFAIPINTVKRDLSDLKEFGRIKRPLLGIRYLTVDEKLQGKLNLPVSQGAMIINEDPKTSGIIPNSPAAQAKLKEGDIITEYNGQPITSQKTIQDFLEDAEVGETVNLTVLRNGKKLNSKLTLLERKV